MRQGSESIKLETVIEFFVIDIDLDLNFHSEFVLTKVIFCHRSLTTPKFSACGGLEKRKHYKPYEND